MLYDIVRRMHDYPQKGTARSDLHIGYFLSGQTFDAELRRGSVSLFFGGRGLKSFSF